MFQHIQLPNGLTIIAESNPTAESLALGFFVKTGSRDESPEVSGVSHFLEHMAFKGDEHYTGEDVNRIFDEVGAKYNASTSEEVTCYYAAILPEYLRRTFTLLTTLIRPSLRDDDFDVEKQVIIEEIGMYRDMPPFHLYEQAMSFHFSGHPLGNSILGTAESVGALTSAQMRAYHNVHYQAGNIVLVAAGRVDWDELLGLANEFCIGWPAGQPERTVETPQVETKSQWLLDATLNQQHVMQMASAPSGDSAQRYIAELVSVMVGDDSSGRLYWELVDPGHAESADLSFNDYIGAGAWSTYVCCRPELTLQNLDKVRQIYEEFNKNGPSAEEFERARTKVGSRVVLGSERPMGRLTSLGGNWLSGQGYRSVEDDLETLAKLSLKDVHELLAEFPLLQSTSMGYGPFEGK